MKRCANTQKDSSVARSADTQHVLVRGKVVVRHRELQTLDLELIGRQVQEVAERINSDS